MLEYLKNEDGCSYENTFSVFNVAKNEMLERRTIMYQKIIKRGFDIAMSFVAIVLLLPFFALIALCVFAYDGKSPILAQRRVGKGGREFLMYKFRSMKLETPDVPTGSFANIMEYITPIGRILRKTSIDELPQLFNILIGDMSFVGPRPALWNERELIDDRDRWEINSILPGLTGLAQVNGRAKLSLERRIHFDKEYTSSLKQGGFKAFLMDIKCILKTFIVVFKFKDVT